MHKVSHGSIETRVHLQCTLLLNQNLFVHICSYCIVTSVIIIQGDAGWHSWQRHFTASGLQQQPSAAERDSAGFCVFLYFPSVIYLTVLRYRTFIRQAHSCYSNPQSLSAVLSGKMKSCHEIEMDKIFFIRLSFHRKCVCEDTHVSHFTGFTVCKVEQGTLKYMKNEDNREQKQTHIVFTHILVKPA